MSIKYIMRAKFEALIFQVKTLAAHSCTQLVYATHRRAKEEKARAFIWSFMEAFLYKPNKFLH
jgi:hypothetical protein